MVLWLLITGGMFSSLLSQTGVTNIIGQLIMKPSANPWVALSIMLLVIYILGMFIDAGPIIIICLPLFMPIIRQLGFDPLWFGLVFTMGIIVGFITPPFGINLFYFKGINHPGVAMADIYRATIPFAIIVTIAWILCIIFPEIAIWLPNRMIK